MSPLPRLHGAFWFRIHLAIVRRLPEALKRLLVPWISTLAVAVLPSIRRAVASNLSAVLGPAGRVTRWRRAARNLRQHGWCMTERLETLDGGRSVEVEIEGEEHWQAIAGGSEGFVLATAHVGHWEIGSAFPNDVDRRTVHMVREEELDPEAQEVFQQLLASGRGPRFVVHYAGRDRSLGTRLLLALRRGDAIALQADRPAAEGRTLDLDLFGRPFAAPIGPLAMARTAEVPILPVYVYRAGRLRSRLVFRPPIRVDRTADRDADLERAGRALLDEVERAIRREPYQWFCFRSLWPAHERADRPRAESTGMSTRQEAPPCVD